MLWKYKMKAMDYFSTCVFHYINMFEALYSLSAKNSKEIGPSSNEGLKYRDIESVKFEYGKCCAHFFRGSIYILEPVDTGHFFNTSLIQGLVFKGIVKGQESRVWAFFKGLRSFRGPQKQNWKNDQNSIIFGAKIKVRINFIWEKLMEFLLLNEVLKNWIFFRLLIQKSDFITLILSKFSILNANLWSIYS